jgi:hypothetical protein
MPDGNTDTSNTKSPNKYWSVDFGTSYGNYHITGMWTRYKPFSPSPHNGFVEVWWDNDNDSTDDGTSAGTMNFGTGSSLAGVSTQQWVRDREFTSTPITAQNRYLIFKVPASGDNKPNEFYEPRWRLSCNFGRSHRRCGATGARWFRLRPAMRHACLSGHHFP